MVAACEEQYKSYNNMKKRTFRVLRKLSRRHYNNHDLSIHSLAEIVNFASLPLWNWCPIVISCISIKTAVMKKKVNT